SDLLRTHPLLLHAELYPEREEEESESDEPAHLGEGNRGAEESGQNARVDGVTGEGVGTGGDQLVVLLDGDGAAPVAAEIQARPDGEQKAGDRDRCSQPEGPKARPPELEVEPGRGDARDRGEEERDRKKKTAREG